jgi:hypothetical protein
MRDKVLSQWVYKKEVSQENLCRYKGMTRHAPTDDMDVFIR